MTYVCSGITWNTEIKAWKHGSLCNIIPPAKVEKKKQLKACQVQNVTTKAPAAWPSLTEGIRSGHSHTPVLWVVLLSAHDYSLEHGSLSHHKLNHPVDEAQQVPGRIKDKGYESMNECTLLPLSPFLSSLSSRLWICQLWLTLKYLKRLFSSKIKYRGMGV